MYIESICDDNDIVMQNIREVKISSPDYVGMEEEKAVEDFIGRIKHYQDAYETLSQSENVAYVKLINVGREGGCTIFQPLKP